MKWMHKTATFFKAGLLGALACQSFLGAVFVTGWSYRYSRRKITSYWQRRAGVCDSKRSPRWLLSETEFTGSGWLRVKWMFGSLKKNFVCGLGHVFTAFAITVLPGTLLAFAWWGGWNNSFHKGYEQSGVGPGLGFLGILLMAIALLYLPMAQSHQAAHRRVGSFFEFRKITAIIRAAPWGSLLLSICTALCALPFLISALYLSTAAASKPELLEMPPVQIVQYLGNYYFLWALLFVFPSFLLLRLLAARIYAGTTWKLAGWGRYQHGSLAGLVEVSPPPMHRRARKYWRRGWKTMVFAGNYASLLMFASLPLLAQFSNAMPATRRWLQHPLVQLPLHRHIPEPLAKAAKSRFGKEPSGFFAWLDAQDE